MSVDSALGHHPDPRHDLAFPDDQTWVGQGVGHLELLNRLEVYEQIRCWLQEAESGVAGDAGGH